MPKAETVSQNTGGDPTLSKKVTSKAYEIKKRSLLEDLEIMRKSISHKIKELL